MLTSGAQDLRRAAELAELAVVEAGDDDAARALALETSAILDMNLDRADRARVALASSPSSSTGRLGDARGVARILDGRAMATFLDGRITEGVALFGRVAQLFEDSGDLLRVVTPRSTRGHGLVFADRAADGLAETDAALRLARELDAPEGQAYALWHRSEALSGAGPHRRGRGRTPGRRCGSPAPRGIAAGPRPRTGRWGSPGRPPASWTRPPGRSPTRPRSPATR